MRLPEEELGFIRMCDVSIQQMKSILGQSTLARQRQAVAKRQKEQGR